MSCRELERLYVEEAPAADLATHRAACPACEQVAKDVEMAMGLSAGLVAPRWTAALRDALLDIPRQTVSCSQAPDLMALSLDDALDPAQAQRLAAHLSRCEGCAQAALALNVLPELETPPAAPWLFGRIAVSKPRRMSSGWLRLLAPRAVVAYAYAAAIVVMVAGFNPADLARKAGVGVQENTREVVAVAGTSLADRFGQLQEKVIRGLTALKGRAGGYGRAALSNALALVMKEETPRPPTRPRSGEGSGSKGNQTQVMTWRA
jgi:putative zinc finger protein